MQIKLRKLNVNDKRFFAVWWRSRMLAKLTSGYTKTLSESEITKYFLALLHSTADYHYIVTLQQRSIGHIALMKREDGWYEIQIIIGYKKYWGKGYGPQAIKKIISIARRYGVKKIYLEVRPTNKRAVAAYKNCGFQEAEIKKYPKNKYLKETLKMVLKTK